MPLLFILSKSYGEKSLVIDNFSLGCFPPGILSFMSFIKSWFILSWLSDMITGKDWVSCFCIQLSHFPKPLIEGNILFFQCCLTPCHIMLINAGLLLGFVSHSLGRCIWFKTNQLLPGLRPFYNRTWHQESRCLYWFFVLKVAI